MMTRGGARKGAGQKPGKHGKKIDRNIALTADVWAYHAKNDESLGRSIEAMTRRSGAFKAWMKWKTEEQRRGANEDDEDGGASYHDNTGIC